MIRTRKIAEVVDSICGRKNKWTKLYPFAIAWLEDPSNPGGIFGAVEKVIVQSDGRVFIPNGFRLSRVGINVNGSFAPLLRNPNMVYDSTCCEPFVQPDTGHPDSPAFTAGSTNPVPHTWNNYGWYDGWYSGGSRADTLWPGQGGGRSVYGYYNFLDGDNFIFLDKAVGAVHEYILMEGTYPAFVPGKETLLNVKCVPAVTAYCLWKDKQNESLVSPSKRADVPPLYRQFVAAMRELEINLCEEPICVLVAAFQSAIGQVGP
jgi:hypothetical protein